MKLLSKSNSNMFSWDYFMLWNVQIILIIIKLKKTYLTIKYIFNEKDICEIAFLHIYSLSKNKWKEIRNHYQTDGFTPIIHGNKRRKSSYTLSFETILHITSFIINYANIHELPSSSILLIKLMIYLFIYKTNILKFFIFRS